MNSVIKNSDLKLLSHGYILYRSSNTHAEYRNTASRIIFNRNATYYTECNIHNLRMSPLVITPELHEAITEVLKVINEDWVAHGSVYITEKLSSDCTEPIDTTDLNLGGTNATKTYGL